MKAIGQSASIKDFKDFNYIYIDKTEQIHSLLWQRRVFFSRPRRFGKSLVLDTIATLFEQGVEPYFKDTWIYDKWSQKTYPVLRLNFLDFGNDSLEKFTIKFNNYVSEFAKELQLENDVVGIDPAETLLKLCNALKDKKIVILIDEYDCQLTANINFPELYQKFISCIREIYATLKGKAQIRFLCITGVTRLKDATMFSVGSDIVDMSNDHSIATLVGFTRAEIKKFYSEYLAIAAMYANNCQLNEVTEAQKESILDKLAEEYDGYCFDEMYLDKVFSTWSINSFFSALVRKQILEYGDYWYDNGGLPSILAKYLNSHNLDMSIFQDGGILVNRDKFDNPTSLLSIDQNVLMYQTGYLSLCSKKDGFTVKLSTPNMEVQRALMRLMAFQIYDEKVILSKDYKTLFMTENADDMVSELNCLLNSVSYDKYPITNESVLRVCLQCFFNGIANNVYAEMHNAKGRADLIVDLENRRIVFELKFADRAQ